MTCRDFTNLTLSPTYQGTFNIYMGYVNVTSQFLQKNTFTNVIT